LELELGLKLKLKFEFELGSELELELKLKLKFQKWGTICDVIVSGGEAGASDLTSALGFDGVDGNRTRCLQFGCSSRLHFLCTPS
jgi:hypothetical protein